MASLIKPSHRGLLHKKLHMRAGAHIPLQRLEAAKKARDPAMRKMANFAINLNHGKAKASAGRDHAKRMYGAKK